MSKKVNTKEYLTPQDLEKQEHLSKETLESLIDVSKTGPSYRPDSNFIDLMNWVVSNYSSHLSSNEGSLEKFVHNRIVINGQFLEFCKHSKTTVKCLFKDSLVSWNAGGHEKFFAQGVFLIEAKGVKFLHSALYHKGAQNDDEICFSVIVARDNYEKYIELRNEFDSWVQKRDRGSLHIRVVDGEDIPYSKDQSWDDVFLPEHIKKDLKSLVEGFLSSKDFYNSNKMPWKRGFLLWGPAGNGKSSIIKTIMSEYEFKPVTILPGAGDDAIREAFSYAESQSPSLLFFEDLDSMLGRTIDISSFLNLMDGVSAKDGLLIVATANDVRQLKSNITDRPSRFDRKFEIPLPNQEMSYVYLKKWFGNLLTVKKCREFAKLAEKYKFSYAYLKDFYISSMFEALSNNRKIPSNNDIVKAFSCLIKDKFMLSNDRTIDTDKYFH